MSDQAAPQSLADRARRLAALARAKSETAESSADQARLGDQIQKLTFEVGALKASLDVRARLEEAGVPVASMPDLSREPAEFRQEIDSIGRPTWQKVQAKVRSVARTRLGITDADTVAWKEWAQERVSSLPLALVPRLGFTRGVTETRVRTLRTLAVSVPTLSNVREFAALLAHVEHDLAQVEDAGVDAVLNRFVQRRILLANLNDEELELLRADRSLRDQLYVSLA